jgi:hypothetical protein
VIDPAPAPAPASDASSPGSDRAPAVPTAGNGHPGPAAAAEPHHLARRAADFGRVERHRPEDRMLDVLLLAAEREVRVGLTVVVGHVVVTGTLVGTLAYCRALADQFASAAGGTGMDEAFAESFRSLVDDAHDLAQGDRRSPADAASYERAVGFLHLADARYVSDAGLLPHGRRGVLWRCRVADVTSWSLGDLISG